MCLSNDESDCLRRVVVDACTIATGWGSMREARRMRLASRGTFGSSLRLVGVDEPGLAVEVGAEVERLAGRPGGLRPSPLITGDDLIGLGLAPGPGFARWLEAVYDAQLEGEVSSREEALGLAERLARGGGEV